MADDPGRDDRPDDDSFDGGLPEGPLYPDDILAGGGADAGLSVDDDGLVHAEVLASVGRRVMARLLNSLFWIIVTAGTLVAIYGPESDPDATTVVPAWATLAVWVLPIVVDIGLTSRFGWDPGKLVLGLRVVDRNGDPPGPAAATIRTTIIQAAQLLALVPWWIGFVASWLTLPWALVLIWSMATGPDRQGLQDRPARTWVVQRRQLAVAPAPDDEPPGDRGA